MFCCGGRGGRENTSQGGGVSICWRCVTDSGDPQIANDVSITASRATPRSTLASGGVLAASACHTLGDTPLI